MSIITPSTLHDVPMPAGAIAVATWDDVQHGAKHTHRYFRGSSWVVERDKKDTVSWSTAFNGSTAASRGRSRSLKATLKP